MKPTKAQIKEFWEKCGFEGLPDKPYYGKYWRYPEGTGMPPLELPPIDLNNLFKYAVPKVKYCCLTKPEHPGFNGMWLCEVRLGVEQGHSEDKDPALALFWALWEVKEKSNEQG